MIRVGGKSKDQQEQFFRYCLLPQYNAELRIDFEAELDSSLTTGENWRLLDERYDITNSEDKKDYEELEWQYIADQLRSQGCDVARGEVKQLYSAGINPFKALENPDMSIESALQTLSD